MTLPDAVPNYLETPVLLGRRLANLRESFWREAVTKCLARAAAHRIDHSPDRVNYRQTSCHPQPDGPHT